MADENVDSETNQAPATSQSESTADKKPYEAPVLKKHGDLRQVTFSSHSGVPTQTSGPEDWRKMSEGRRGNLAEKSQIYATQETGKKGPLPDFAPDATPADRDPYKAFKEGSAPTNSVSDQDKQRIARNSARVRRGSTG